MERNETRQNMGVSSQTWGLCYNFDFVQMGAKFQFPCFFLCPESNFIKRAIENCKRPTFIK